MQPQYRHDVLFQRCFSAWRLFVNCVSVLLYTQMYIHIDQTLSAAKQSIIYAQISIWLMVLLLLVPSYLPTVPVITDLRTPIARPFRLEPLSVHFNRYSMGLHPARLQREINHYIEGLARRDIEFFPPRGQWYTINQLINLRDRVPYHNELLSITYLECWV